MLADISGVQCALRMAAKIEDFDYAAFFTKYAQMNASIDLYSYDLMMLQQDEHPLNYLRTNVPVQQFDEFYEAFDVQEGDNMYLAPESRVLVW
jgi:putative endopeptidase